jgi:hypothetical protein
MNLSTQLDTDFSELQRAATATVYYGELLAAALNSAASALWDLPEERKNPLLEKLGPEKVAQLVVAHTSIGTAVNESLANAGSTVRVTVQELPTLPQEPTPPTVSETQLETQPP